MTDIYQCPHFQIFIQTPFRRQPPFNNVSPYHWAKYVIGEERESLSITPVDRLQVRQLCKASNDVLDGYLTAMAWGAQGSGPSGTTNAKLAWSQHKRIEDNLKQIRDKSLSRMEAFKLFDKKNPIKGLGASYFTKLLYFFSATGEGQSPDRYIMDKWTGMSINLLTGDHVVRMARSKSSKTGVISYSLSTKNNAENYEAFCVQVDALACQLNQLKLGHDHTGEDIEQMLFSLGAMSSATGRTQREPWRAYVHANWEAERPPHRYSAKRLVAYQQRAPIPPQSSMARD